MKTTTIILNPTASLAEGICCLANTQSTRPLATLISLTVLPIFLAFEGAARCITVMSNFYYLTPSQFSSELDELNNIGLKLTKVFQHPITLARELLSTSAHHQIDQDQAIKAATNPPPTDFKSRLQAWVELEKEASVKTAKQIASKKIEACFEAQKTENPSRHQQELAKKLDLSGLAINSLPECLAELSPHLRELNLSNTQLTELPENLNQLTHLQTLHCASLSRLTTFPRQLLQLKSLFILNLASCYIKTIPVNEISTHLRQLKTLKLTGNPLDTDTTDEITRRHALNASQQRASTAWQGLTIITQ